MRDFFYDIYIDVIFALSCVAYAISEWRFDTTYLVGIGIACVSLVLWIRARQDLGDAYAVLPSGKKLVTCGIYAYIRHPMYVFSTLTMFGVALATHSPIFYAITALVACTQLVRARLEEHTLVRRFGASYATYKKRTIL